MDHLQRGWAIMFGCIAAGGVMATLASNSVNNSQEAVGAPSSVNADSDSSGTFSMTDSERPPSAGPSDDATQSTPRQIGAAVTADWLIGKWGPPGCETDNVVYFERGGRYSDGGAKGEFAVADGRITYFHRILIELGSDAEDYSEYDRPIITRVERVSDDALREDGDMLTRCPNSG